MAFLITMICACFALPYALCTSNGTRIVKGAFGLDFNTPIAYQNVKNLKLIQSAEDYELYGFDFPNKNFDKYMVATTKISNKVKMITADKKVDSAYGCFMQRKEIVQKLEDKYLISMIQADNYKKTFTAFDTKSFITNSLELFQDIVFSKDKIFIGIYCKPEYNNKYLLHIVYTDERVKNDMALLPKKEHDLSGI